MATMTRTGDPYFDWMCQRVGIGEQFGRPYRKLAHELHETRFRPTMDIPMDGNRIYDGLEMRLRFMHKYGEGGSSTDRGPCTMLEFLVGMAEKMSFLMSDEKNQAYKRTEYFWHLIRNLRLLRLTDDIFDERHGEFHVRDAVERVVNRTYDANGDGGLFPLRNPKEDQRYVDIWYQMHAWLAEHCSIDTGQE